MKFNFEESELINNFFEGTTHVSKDDAVSQLLNASDNTEDIVLVDIAHSTIAKLESLNNQAFDVVFSSLPIDPYTEF